jgi:hypothetical protein
MLSPKYLAEKCFFLNSNYCYLHMQGDKKIHHNIVFLKKKANFFRLKLAKFAKIVITTLTPGRPEVSLQRDPDVHDARRVHLPAQPGAAASALAGPDLRRHLHARRRLHGHPEGRLLLPPVPGDDPG